MPRGTAVTEQLGQENAVPGVLIAWGSDTRGQQTAHFHKRDPHHGLGVMPILECCPWISPTSADLPSTRAVAGELSAFMGSFRLPPTLSSERMETWLLAAETKHPADYNTLDWSGLVYETPLAVWADLHASPAPNPGKPRPA